MLTSLPVFLFFYVADSISQKHSRCIRIHVISPISQGPVCTFLLQIWKLTITIKE